jgi:hypothetical protein
MNDSKSQCNADCLQEPARTRFGTLSAAEETLIRCAITGKTAYCGTTTNDSDPSNNPAGVDTWGAARQIRAALIRWLCVDRFAKLQVDPMGMQLHGAQIIGDLNLSYAALLFPVSLWHCAIASPIQMESTEIPELDLAGTWVRSLNCSGIRVKGSVYLLGGFQSNGHVDLSEAVIGSSLVCDGGRFLNAPGHENIIDSESGFSLDCDRANIAGNVSLRGPFYAEGEIRFLNARIGGDFDCGGATIRNPRTQGKLALQAEGITVQGTVSLGDGFFPVGDVALPGARITGVLDFRDGNFILAALDLRDASVGALMDNVNAWLPQGKLRLDGFVYDRISEGPRTAEERLPWLALQPEFRTQPYLQLSKILRAKGDDEGALKVLIEMERRRAVQTPTDHAWRPLYGTTVGYGYRPLRAFWELAGLGALGWILYRRSYIAGNMVPSEEDAYSAFKRDGRPPPHYPEFVPIVYSLENSIPLVKLGQGDKWQPDPSNESPPVLANEGTVKSPRPTMNKIIAPFVRFLTFCGLLPNVEVGHAPSRISRWGTSARFLRWFLWTQIFLGWLLATLFLAGVTQIVRTQ